MPASATIAQYSAFYKTPAERYPFFDEASRVASAGVTPSASAANVTLTAGIVGLRLSTNTPVHYKIGVGATATIADNILYAGHVDLFTTEVGARISVLAVA